MAYRAKLSFPFLDASIHSNHSLGNNPIHSKFQLHKTGVLTQSFVSSFYHHNHCLHAYNGLSKPFRFSCNASPISTRSVEGFASPFQLDSDNSLNNENLLCFLERESNSTQSGQKPLESYDKEFYCNGNAFNGNHVQSDPLHSHAVSRVPPGAIKNDQVLEHLNVEADVLHSTDSHFAIGIPPTEQACCPVSEDSSKQNSDDNFTPFFPADENSLLECSCSTSSSHINSMEFEFLNDDSGEKSWVCVFKESVDRIMNEKNACRLLKTANSIPASSESDKLSATKNSNSNEKLQSVRRLDFYNPLFALSESTVNSLRNKKLNKEYSFDEKMNDSSDCSSNVREFSSELKARMSYETNQKNSKETEFSSAVRAIVWCMKGVKNANQVDRLLNGFHFPLPVFSSVLQKLGKEKNLVGAVSLFHWLFLRSKAQSYNSENDSIRANEKQTFEQNLMSNTEYGSSNSNFTASRVFSNCKSNLNGLFESNNENHSSIITASSSSASLDPTGSTVGVTSASVSNSSLNVFVYNCFLGALKAMDEIEIMTKVIETMEKEGIEPDAVTFNILLGVFAKEGCVSSSFTLFDHMKRVANLTPDLFTYRTLISLCKKKRLTGNTLNLYERAKAFDLPCERTKEGGYRVGLEAEVRKICLSEMTLLLSENTHDPNQTDAILLLFWRMQRAGIHPCKEAYHTAITACCRFPDRHLNNLRLLFVVMQRSGFVPRVDLCNDTIKAFGKAKKWWSALEIFEKMKVNGPPPNVYTHRELNNQFRILFNSAKKRRLWKWSLLLINRMMTVGLNPDFYCWKTVLATCAASSQPEAAVDVFERMMGLGFTPDAFAYGCLLSALEKGGLAERVEEVWLHMKKLNIPCNAEAYTTLISSYGKTGSYEKAKCAFERMKEEGVEVDVVAYNAIITACIHCGKAEESLLWLDEMKENGVNPNEVSFQQIILALLEQERLSDAMEIYEQLTHRGLTPTQRTKEKMKSACSAHGISFDSFTSLIGIDSNLGTILSPP